MSPITTHVLDLALGCPAQGIAVTLSARAADGRWEELAHAITDADGRVREFPLDGRLIRAGDHQLRFDVAAYFLALVKPTFYPEVVVAFRVEDPNAHHHVPLLLSPFGYSTYRGS